MCFILKLHMMTTGATVLQKPQEKCNVMMVCLEVSDTLGTDSNLSRDRGGHCSS